MKLCQDMYSAWIAATHHELVSCRPVTYTDQITIVLPPPSSDEAFHSTLLAAGEEAVLNVEIKPRYNIQVCTVAVGQI